MLQMTDLECVEERALELLQEFEHRHRAGINSLWQAGRRFVSSAGEDYSVDITYCPSFRRIRFTRNVTNEYVEYLVWRGLIKILDTNVWDAALEQILLDVISQFSHRYRLISPLVEIPHFEGDGAL